MRPAALKAIREASGLSVTEFGAALGYSGDRRNISRTVRRLEAGDRDITPDVEAAALALMTPARRAE